MRRTFSLIAALAACALVLAASGCGGGSDGDTADADAASGNAVGRDDAMLLMARCLRKQGLDVEDPRPGQPMQLRVDRADDARTRTANETCQKELADVLPEPSAEDRERMRENGLEFARCMRKNGVDMPDPTADGGGVFRFGGDGIDPQSETFKKAQKACGDIMRGMLREPGEASS
jgi:hypothetical protein